MAYSQINRKTYYKPEDVKKILSLDSLTSAMERLFTGKKPSLHGEHFYTDDELSKKLKLSRRSLQDYRNEGRIPYVKLGGKILYRSSDIEKLLEDGYHQPFREVKTF